MTCAYVGLFLVGFFFSVVVLHFHRRFVARVSDEQRELRKLARLELRARARERREARLERDRLRGRRS